MASIQATDPVVEDLKSKPTAGPVASKPANDEGFFGAFRKGITQPIKMPTMTNFAIPIPATSVTPQPELSKPRPQQTDEQKRLQQALDEKEMAQAEISRLSGQMAELLAERQRDRSMIERLPALESELEKLRSEVSKTRDRADYKRMEANEIETQKTKEMNQNLKNDVSSLKQELQSLQSKIGSLTETNNLLQNQISKFQKIVSDTEFKLSEAERSAEAATQKSANLSAEIASVINARDEALAKLAMSREAVALETRRDRERWQTKAAEKERQFFVELDATVADRNSWRAKAESLQVALDKALKKLAASGESVKWSQEKSRLEAELQRKTTSLQDAMDALQTRDSVKKSMAILTIEAQCRIPQLAGPDVKVIEQNPALQSLMQSFMESINDRDALITQLKLDNTALNQNIT